MENHKDKLMIYLNNQWNKELSQIKDRTIKLNLENDLINDLVRSGMAGKTFIIYYTMKKLLGKINSLFIKHVSLDK